jgi:hypothetical protein
MSIARHIPTVLRFIYGIPLVLFGAMDLFHPMTPPPGMPAAALHFSQALGESGYMMPMIGIVLLVGGVLVVANRFVPLALLLLAPFWVNSALFHTFLERSGLPMVAVFVALELYMAWQHRGAFAAVLKARNPTT